MKENEIIHHRFFSEQLKIDIPEILRYLGYPKSKIEELSKDSKEIQLIDESISMMKKVIQPQSLYQKVKINFAKNVDSEDVIKIADYCIQSNDLKKNLSHCNYAIMLVATIGSGADFLIKKYSKIDSARSAILQATGSMFIESYVDYLNNILKEEFNNEGIKTYPRFSPGYGDLSLSTQNIFFTLLPCTQKIGLTLMDTLIMAPEKSVTAFIGIENIE